jgi:hypothetical protein
MEVDFPLDPSQDKKEFFETTHDFTDLHVGHTVKASRCPRCTAAGEVTVTPAIIRYGATQTGLYAAAARGAFVLCGIPRYNRSVLSVLNRYKGRNPVWEIELRPRPRLISHGNISDSPKTMESETNQIGELSEVSSFVPIAISYAAISHGTMSK